MALKEMDFFFEGFFDLCLFFDAFFFVEPIKGSLILSTALPLAPCHMGKGSVAQGGSTGAGKCGGSIVVVPHGVL